MASAVRGLRRGRKSLARIGLSAAYFLARAQAKTSLVHGRRSYPRDQPFLELLVLCYHGQRPARRPLTNDTLMNMDIIYIAILAITAAPGALVGWLIGLCVGLVTKKHGKVYGLFGMLLGGIAGLVVGASLIVHALAHVAFGR